MEQAAKARIPRFAYDYLSGGIGREANLRVNTEILDTVQLRPRYISEVGKPDCGHSLFGKRYDAPFGVAPIGLSGLMWPKAPEHLAAAAKTHNIPFILSGFSTSSVEDIAGVSGACQWFQMYVTNRRG